MLKLSGHCTLSTSPRGIILHIFSFPTTRVRCQLGTCSTFLNLDQCQWQWQLKFASASGNQQKFHYAGCISPQDMSHFVPDSLYH